MSEPSDRLAVLFDIMKNGMQRNAPADCKSATPASGTILSDEDIRASLAYIEST